MRSLALFFVVFSFAGALFGQVAVPLPPVFSGLSSSVVDSNGNLLIFDNSFAVPLGVMATTFSSKTHVTVVGPDGKTTNGTDYSGAFQILGVGRDAVYALVSTFGTVTMSPIPAFSRQVVALHVVAGTLPASLPSIDVPMNDDVKLSPGTAAGGADMIALVSNALPTLTATPVAGFSHQVLLFTCDCTKFFPNSNNPIMTH